MRKLHLLLVTALCTVLVAGPAGAQSETATVTLVHGFRGLLADVYLDGERILEGFEPARSTDPTDLPAGEHEVEVREADAAADSTPVVSGTLDLPADANLSAVVHPDADGNPTISVFDNGGEAPAEGRARAVVRHTAVAPAIAVTFGDDTVVSGLGPGEEGAATIRPGTDDVTTTAATSSEQLLPPTRATADAGTTLALYLIGSADEDSLGWLSQRLDTGAGTTPLGVPTGDSGLADVRVHPWMTWLAAVAALVVAARFARVATTVHRR